MPTTYVRCTCGSVELALDGRPIATVACYCDDCQRAGAQFAAVPGGAAPAIDADGGTPYVMYRKDRAAVTRGAERLVAHRLTPQSATLRQVATCCKAPMLVTFDGGPLHWVSVYRHRFGSEAPRLEMRTQTRFAPQFKAPDDGVPSYKAYPLRFVVRLVAARIAMLLGR